MKSCAAFSLALDDSTDIRDTALLVTDMRGTALLVIFIREVTVGFDVLEELLEMASFSSTTTGQDICEHVIRAVETFNLNPAKLSGLTTDCAPSMTGRTDGFTKKFLDAVGAQDVVVSHYIVHQENLCTNVLALAEDMKNVVQCANYTRARGLNHRQFKAFQEYLYCDNPVVVYFSAVRWHSRAVTLKRFWKL